LVACFLWSSLEVTSTVGPNSESLPGQLQNALGEKYIIQEELGAGGMSRVFVAKDLGLDRHVVVKVLPPELAGAVSGERFKREIALAAQLQHPHIVPVLHAGDAGGLLFYTMPRIEGVSLRAHLARSGELAVRPAVDILRDVAKALAYAHSRGVVHRDIKPENIILTGDTAVVLDFGVAKALSASGTAHGAATTAGSLTATGVAVGTPAYMAPEQVAADHTADHRVDIYAFGVVAFEMLTGAAPFGGRSVQATLAAHVAEPAEDIARRRKSLPAPLADLVMSCLEKHPADRPQSATEIIRVLETISPSDGAMSAVARRRATRMSRREMVAWIAAGAMGVVAVSALARVWSSSAPAPVTHSTILPPFGMAFHIERGFALSQDGRTLAFVGDGVTSEAAVWVQRLDEAPPDGLPGEPGTVTAARTVTGTSGALGPFWSPDGRQIAFFAGGQLRRVSAAGGSAVAVCDCASYERGTWNQDGDILFAGEDLRLYRVKDAGRNAPESMLPDSVRVHSPRFFADGRHFLYLAAGAGESVGFSELWLGDLDGSAPTHIRSDINGAEPVGRDALVFQSGGALYTQRFDLANRRLVGEPVVIKNATGYPGRAPFSVAGQRIVNWYGWQIGPRTWVDRTGAQRDTVPRQGRTWFARISHDDSRILFSGISLWILEPRRGGVTRVGAAQMSSAPVSWAPGDTALIYAQGRAIMSLGLRESAVPETLFTASDAHMVMTPEVHRNGMLVFTRIDSGPASRSSIWSLDLRSKQVYPLVQQETNAAQGAVSPDGAWLAYQSQSTGSTEIYLRRLRSGGVPLRISSTGGRFPHWRGDGRELFFLGPRRTVMAVSVEGADASGVAEPRVLFSYPIAESVRGTSSPYTVTSDGQRFLFMTAPRDLQSQSLLLTDNWKALLESVGRRGSLLR
jgi:serine/threonine-protein kinase